MHQAGAVALTQLLQFEQPDADHLEVPCLCGHNARFKEMRTKSFLSAVGTVEARRPYYHCSHCFTGQHPVDCELGIAGLESSPGVRRMEAIVGSEMPFTPACEPMKVLAGLEVPAKALVVTIVRSIRLEQWYPPKPSSGLPRVSARRSPHVTGRKSTGPGNSSCLLFPDKTSPGCMC